MRLACELAYLVGRSIRRIRRISAQPCLRLSDSSLIASGGWSHPETRLRTRTGSRLCAGESLLPAPLRITRVSMSRVSKLSLRRDTPTIRYLGCWHAAPVSDLSGSWEQIICGVSIAGRSGAKLPSRYRSLSSTVWVQAFMPPQVPRATSLPERASRNTPLRPCRTERRQHGRSFTASNRRYRQRPCAPSVGESARLAILAAHGQANPSPKRAVIGVETRSQSANSLQVPAGGGVERGRRGTKFS